MNMGYLNNDYETRAIRVAGLDPNSIDHWSVPIGWRRIVYGGLLMLAGWLREAGIDPATVTVHDIKEKHGRIDVHVDNAPIDFESDLEDYLTERAK